MRDFLKTLFPNLLQSFSKRFILWHIVAIIVTYLLVVSGFDWWYFLWVRNPLLNTLFFPAIVLGGLVPIFLPLVLLAMSKMRKDAQLARTAWTLGQAAFLGWLISSIYKAFTGRLQPNLQDLTLNISDQFQFGFWNHGIFWGWPSSHTTVAFAVAVTVCILFPKNIKTKWIALASALYVGIGVSFSIHWFSEFVAGALIGSVIGMVVGKKFSLPRS